MSVTVLSQRFVKQADLKKKKKNVSPHIHTRHIAKKTKPYNNSQAYEEKKKTRKQEERRNSCKCEKFYYASLCSSKLIPAKILFLLSLLPIGYFQSIT